VLVLVAAVTSLAYRCSSHFRCYCGGIYRRKRVVLPVYKLVGYTRNSSLVSMSWRAHAAGESIFCHEVW